MVFLSIIEANVPIWGQRVEITRVMSNLTLGYIAEKFGAKAENGVFVQVVDCKSEPAAGVSIELPDSPNAKVVYVDHTGPVLEAPLSLATGAAGIYDHDKTNEQRIVARKNGRVVAKYSGVLEAGNPRYIRLQPNPAEGP
jgi:hypothetical protein